MSKRGFQNKRYRQTEEAIIEVLLKSRAMPSTGELTKRARISRTTLYRHHKAIPGIVPDYENELLTRFRRVLRKLLRQKGLNLKDVYLRALFFVLRYKRVYKILFRYEGDRVVERMVMEMRLLVLKNCKLPRGSERILRIYAKEVAGVVEMWGENGFPDEKMNGILGDIMSLTDGIRERLGRFRAR